MKLSPWLIAVAALGAAGAARAEDGPALPPAQAPPAEVDARDLIGKPGDDALAPHFADPAFGPRYVIEDIVVRGNGKTQTAVILSEIRVRVGDQVDASDPRVEAARYRLLALGFFLDARLSVQRGTKRGGVVLLVEVEERGTIVVNDLFASHADATSFWGGLDAGESNFLGRGINLGAGFVASTTPHVPGAEAGWGARLHLAVPALRDSDISLGANALFNDGSEFIRTSGGDKDGTPGNFSAVRTRRAGGVISVGKVLTRSLRIFLDLRQEFATATLPAARDQALPDGSTRPLDFQIHDGDSRVASLTGTVDYDTRSDPVLPRSGLRLVGSIEAAAPGGPGSYGFVKLLGQGSLYKKMPRDHVLGFHLLGGAIGGNAPYFDRFFIGDLNPLLPRRALGINFSTQPSRDFLGSGIAGHRYDNYAGRVLIDYAVPFWRRRSSFVYGGDLFVAVGVLAMASGDDFNRPNGMTWKTAPIDLTGDLGLRLDTYIGVFNLSIANALNRSSF